MRLLNDKMKKITKLAVDAKNLCGPITGISRYLHKSLLYLSESDVRIIIIVPSKINPEFRLPQNIEIIYCNSKNKICWHFWDLAKTVNELEPNFYWGPAHRIPIGINKNIVTVVTCHDLVCFKFPRTMKFPYMIRDRLLLWNAFSRAQLIHAVSNTTLNDIINIFPNLAEKSFSTLPHDPLKIRPKTSNLAVQKNSNYGLFVGTFEPRKNLERLVEAFRRYSDTTGSSGRLVLAGTNGWKMNGFEKLIGKLQNNGLRVEVINSPTDSQLFNLYENARFLIMPSIYEGLGLPVIEAKSHGLPCIVSNIGSLPEVADGMARQVNPYSISEIELALKTFFEDGNEFQHSVEDARNSAPKFDWRLNTEIFLSRVKSISF